MKQEGDAAQTQTGVSGSQTLTRDLDVIEAVSRGAGTLAPLPKQLGLKHLAKEYTDVVQAAPPYRAANDERIRRVAARTWAAGGAIMRARNVSHAAHDRSAGRRHHLSARVFGAACDISHDLGWQERVSSSVA